ncbi:MAG TPA: hypothetical protein VIF09_04240 [Polyangiaceae bacterium]|jgi:hypothetical protein
MSGEAVEVARSERGVPLVATRARWAGLTAAMAAMLVGAVEAYLAYSHSDRTLTSLASVLVLAIAGEALVTLAVLRSEESRLARELRTARTGTAVARGLVARRAARLPLVARWFATRLGTAAVLIADGERDDAVEALRRSSFVMRGGRLDALRAIVEADAERASGEAGCVERAIQRLRGAAPTGNREADLYGTHVLVKALLEEGDAESAQEVIAELEASKDEERQIYVAWLRVWFDLDSEALDYRSAGPALPEGRLRMAMLLARAHGAEKLVEKLEVRVSSIARPALRE